MDILVFQTALGYISLASKDDALCGLTFGHSSEKAATRALARSLKLPSYDISPRSIKPEDEELAYRLAAFANGEQVYFDDVTVATKHLTSFQQDVIVACRAIPHGETRTYGELASSVGHPGAARAVGSVMSKNRIPLVIPCHRVVPAGKGLGGFSAPQGVAMKRRLLSLEQESSQLVAC